jgi:hypothetical protein
MPETTIAGRSRGNSARCLIENHPWPTPSHSRRNSVPFPNRGPFYPTRVIDAIGKYCNRIRPSLAISTHGGVPPGSGPGAARMLLRNASKINTLTTPPHSRGSTRETDGGALTRYSSGLRSDRPRPLLARRASKGIPSRDFLACAAGWCHLGGATCVASQSGGKPPHSRGSTREPDGSELTP